MWSSLKSLASELIEESQQALSNEFPDTNSLPKNNLTPPFSQPALPSDKRGQFDSSIPPVQPIFEPVQYLSTEEYTLDLLQTLKDQVENNSNLQQRLFGLYLHGMSSNSQSESLPQNNSDTASEDMQLYLVQMQEHYAQKIASLSAKCQSLQQNNTQLQITLKNHQDQKKINSQLLHENQSLRARIKMLESLSASSHESFPSLSLPHVQSFDTLHNDYQSKISRLETTIEGLQSKLLEMKTQSKTNWDSILNSERASFQHKLLQLESQISLLKDSHSILEQKNSKLELHIRDKTNQVVICLQQFQDLFTAQNRRLLRERRRRSSTIKKALLQYNGMYESEEEEDDYDTAAGCASDQDSTAIDPQFVKISQSYKFPIHTDFQSTFDYPSDPQKVLKSILGLNEIQLSRLFSRPASHKQRSGLISTHNGKINTSLHHQPNNHTEIEKIQENPSWLDILTTPVPRSKKNLHVRKPEIPDSIETSSNDQENPNGLDSSSDSHSHSSSQTPSSWVSFLSSSFATVSKSTPEVNSPKNIENSSVQGSTPLKGLFINYLSGQSSKGTQQ